jgi:CRISPR-associated protein Csa1
VLKIAKENTLRKLVDELDHRADVTIRGWDPESFLPAEYASIRALPVNMLANNYCPTSRDVYLKQVRNINAPPNWDSYCGRAVHKLFQLLASSAESYIRRDLQLRKFDLQKYVRTQGSRLIQKVTSDMTQVTTNIPQVRRPSQSQIDTFVEGLHKIVRMEAETAGALIDYTLSTNLDTRLAAEFSRIFPFQSREINLNAPPLGFSLGAKPDFLLGDIIGDIKTGQLKEFHKLTLAAYALAYEYHESRPMNFGVLLSVNLPAKRNVPIYEKTEYMVVSDVYRKAFLEKRNEKFRIVRDQVDPGEPTTRDECRECPYFPKCRRWRVRT